MQITPIGATSLATLASVFIIFLALIIFALTYMFAEVSVFFPLMLIVFAAVILKPLSNLPIYLANLWRLRASNQMVLCMLYIVMYMRHTSNLEHAIKFAGLHIGPPLSLDLRKIFWDIESAKYSNVKEALDAYLETWRDHNLEFVNSFHLVESSLFEPSEDRRLQLLDKALEVILEGTYEKMLHYAQDLKNPITMLHMLGVILPILGLVIFPLIASFMGKLIQWYHLAFLYDVILPIVVFTFGYEILSKRPTGYGESDIQKKLEIKKSIFLPFFIIIFFVFLGSLPITLHMINKNFDVGLGDFLGKFLDYRCDGDCGPFGLGSLLISLFIPLGIALGIGVYYKGISKNLITIREETKKLENEFSSSLFQLGNRLSDGVPAEIAFGTVAENMAGTPTGNFFRIVSVNIRNLGMGIKEAIFNQKTGAILSYPSSLIQSSMEVLIESVQKGSMIAAQAMISISTYVSEIHRVNERLKDLLAEIVSSMKSQISFMAPVIAGIVVGIGSMIVGVIVNMAGMFTSYAGNASADSTGFTNVGQFIEIFKVSEIIPSYYFQVVVGIYVVEIIFILTILANGIENGSDKLNQDYLLGKNMIRGAILYTLVAFIVIVLFSLLASTVLQSIPGTI